MIMRRLAQFVRLRASASVSRLCASVSRLSRVCICLRASVCVHLSVSRLSASICLASVSRLSVCLHLSRVCVRLRLRLSRFYVHLSRVCLASVSRLVRLSRVKGSECVHLSASVVLSRVCLSPCECLRELAHFMRRSSFKRV